MLSKAVCASGATVRDFLEQFLGHSRDDFGVFGLLVAQFSAVVVHVVKLDGGKSFCGGGVWFGLAPAARIGRHDQFPKSLSDGKGAVCGMVHQRLAKRGDGLCDEGGEEADAVLCGVFGQWLGRRGWRRRLGRRLLRTR